MNNSLVSIIIPTYNRANLISETLDSIIAQTYSNWECIVVDDGSTDNTKSVIIEYIKKDKRFKYYHRPKDKPKGGNASRNYGFEVSKGKYIKWFDSDDIMYSNFIEVQLSILLNNKLLDFCACQWEYFYENGDIKKNYINLKPENHPLYSYFLEGHVFATPSPLWKRAFLEDKNLFDLELFRGQEKDFHFRMLTNSPNYKLISSFLFKVRRGHDSIESNSNNLLANKSVLILFKKTYDTISKLNFEGKEKLLKYLIYRIVYSVYVDIDKTKSFFKRFSFLIKEIRWLLTKKYSLTSPIIFLGLLLQLTIGKGYKFIYLKKYDFRNENWR